MSGSILSLLITSIVLSTGRNVLSKAISATKANSRGFYLLQGMIFSAGILPLLLSKGVFRSLSLTTVILAVIYAVMLISAQWNYTAALKSGNTGVCATVYALGFIFPTVSGMLFWNEAVSIFRILGIILVIPAIIISGSNQKSEQKGGRYIFPLIIAMLSSGGLGIMQKIQQSTPQSEEKTAFILIAFVVAAAISYIRAFFAEKTQGAITKKRIIFACAVGLCFSICNLLNTVLAGLLDTAVFFPLLNIGSIFASLAAGIIFFREKPDLKSAAVLVLGITSILLINL